MQKGQFLWASYETVQHLESSGNTAGRLRGHEHRWRIEIIPGSQDVAA
jgi:hypothetical protein